MKATRRGVLAGALAVPAAAGVPRMAWGRGAGAVLLHDPALAAGRRLAAAHHGDVLAIVGDRIRLAREVFARRPSLVVGVSRHADAMLIEDVGREAGYVRVDAATDGLRQQIDAARPGDPGLVLGWVLALKR